MAKAVQGISRRVDVKHHLAQLTCLVPGEAGRIRARRWLTFDPRKLRGPSTVVGFDVTQGRGSGATHGAGFGVVEFETRVVSETAHE
jgi:hypothetical protein